MFVWKSDQERPASCARSPARSDEFQFKRLHKTTRWKISARPSDIEEWGEKAPSTRRKRSILRLGASARRTPQHALFDVVRKVWCRIYAERSAVYSTYGLGVAQPKPGRPKRLHFRSKTRCDHALRRLVGSLREIQPIHRRRRAALPEGRR